jgi:hypothetical protein
LANFCNAIIYLAAQNEVANVAGKSLATRKRRDLSLRTVRSALTNGSCLFLGDVDERGPWCRRLRDLQRAHESDLGGREALSEGQRTLLRRIAMLELQLEMLESRFAQNDGEASGEQLMLYQRVASALRRLLESLGLHEGRKARDVTPRLDLDGLIREVRETTP